MARKSERFVLRFVLRGRRGGVIATTAVVFSDGWIGVLIAVNLMTVNAIKLNKLR